METIEIGIEVRDRVTGFSGMTTARCEYITGCTQLLVQPKQKDDGTFIEPRWIDESRLKRVGDGWFTPEVAAIEAHPGPDKPAPIR